MPQAAFHRQAKDTLRQPCDKKMTGHRKNAFPVSGFLL
jgi:hypothetical protein